MKALPRPANDQDGRRLGAGGLVGPAEDWTGQTTEERLILCAEFLFVHGFTGDKQRRQVVDQVRRLADRKRARLAAQAVGSAQAIGAPRVLFAAETFG